MDEKEESDSIERLKRKLYSRTQKGLGIAKRRRLRPLGHDVKEEWKSEMAQKPKRATGKHPVLSTVLLFSAVFFVGSALLAAYFFLGGSVTVSARNINITIEGPTTVESNEELELQISVTNNNATMIQSADLLIEYPDGTRSAVRSGAPMLRHRETLGSLRPGKTVQKTVRSVLYGEEGSEQHISVTLEYRVEGSNAIFNKEQEYSLVLGSAPLEITVDAVEGITSGQEIVFTINVLSNSENTLEGVLLRAEYPFGFSFLSSSPQPVFTNSVWSLGDLEPEERKTVTVRGTVVGENEEERIFRFATGIRSAVDETQLETTFATQSQEVVIEKPFIGITLALNGDGAEPYVASAGKRIRADLGWFNNLPSQILNGSIEVRLAGSIINELSISVQNGFYRSVDDTVLWRSEHDPALSVISEGESGTESFSFETFDLSSGRTFRNPEIKLNVSLRGSRLSEEAVPEAIESTLVRTVKIASDLFLSARALYFGGPFTNTGPIPPRADEETTYTVLWTVTNSYNAVGNTLVTATLPSYARFLGTVSPSTERVTFNPTGGVVSWSVGTIEAGGKRDVAFQVALLPSIVQIGETPIIVENQRVTGTDLFTRTEVRDDHLPLDIRLTSDLSQ